MWKEAVVAEFELSRNLPGDTEDDHEKPVGITGVRAEI
jgi:hypothetical protein